MANHWYEVGIRIYLTGRVSVEINGNVVVPERQFRGKQGRLVFAYLVCERARPVSREELAAVVWPENPSDGWEGALSSLTSKLAALLSTDVLKAQGVSFNRGFGQFQILLPADVWIDLEAGNSALDRAESVLRSGEAGSALGPATVAASIARRPFLPGLNGFWQDSQRRKLERQLLRALDCLYEMQVFRGETELAVETAMEVVVLDPYRERTQRFLMEAYAANGNKAKAVGVYHDFRRPLADDLGTEPSSETETLYLKLLD
ncbi:MAG: hypothetical protein BZY88_13440 [SAR202 cluster bacterium Io17-Chloro-G9]|nr:MAG: hypothetical protein BZY88_13440 [SAR202 cluster bacterium Io17-Chloro-G9]